MSKCLPFHQACVGEGGASLPGLEGGGSVLHSISTALMYMNELFRLLCPLAWLLEGKC